MTAPTETRFTFTHDFAAGRITIVFDLSDPTRVRMLMVPENAHLFVDHVLPNEMATYCQWVHVSIMPGLWDAMNETQKAKLMRRDFDIGALE